MTLSVLFGTDGVRGVANAELTPELSFFLGRAAGGRIKDRAGGKRPRLLVGRDTRASGPMLEAALCAGANSVGVDCVLAGVLPTPGVAYLTREGGFDAGVVISASHNPVQDNGIKFFSPGGFKLTDDEEEAIERDVARLREGDDALPRPVAGEVGGQERAEHLSRRYADFLKRAYELDLSGMSLVIDCANGAASQIAPELFEALGARLVVLNAEPNGVNINVDCGSTHPDVVQQAVKKHGADAGLTYDGDADRVLAVDEKGELVDGDRILAVLGLDLLRRDALPKRKIAVTPYSNLGLRAALEAEGGGVIETAAGDRYVLEAMRKEGLVLGGEQSGHVILLEKNTTGDGLLTSLALLAAARRRQKPLSELCKVMKPYPQILESVPVFNKRGWEENDAIQGAIQSGEKRIGGRGRIFVRASGTEPLIRVMGEGEDEDQVREVVDFVARVIKEELGTD